MSRIDTNFVKQLYSQAGVELTPEKLDHISNNYSSNEELQSAFELKYGSMNASTPEKKNSDVTSTSTSEAPQSESQQPPKKTKSLSVGGKPKKTGASASSAGGGKKVGGKEVKKESPFGPPIQTFQEQKTQEFKEVKKKEEAKKKEELKSMPVLGKDAQLNVPKTSKISTDMSGNILFSDRVGMNESVSRMTSGKEEIKSKGITSEVEMKQAEGLLPPTSALISDGSIKLDIYSGGGIEDLLKPKSFTEMLDQQSKPFVDQVKESNKPVKVNYDNLILANDYNLPNPYLYYSNSKNGGDNQVNELYTDNLSNLPINKDDFDGFLRKKGYLLDLNKDISSGLYNEDRGVFSENYNARLMKEKRLVDYLSMYISDRNQRDYDKRVIEYKKENPKATSEDIDRNVSKFTFVSDKQFGDYIKDTFPTYAKSIEERKIKEKEQWEETKKNKGDFFSWQTLKKIGSGLSETISNRVSNISSTVYDLIGMEGTAKEIRFSAEEDAFKRPENRDISYVSGKKVMYDGNEYLVDSNGQIYDYNLKKRVTDLFTNTDYKLITKAAEKGEDDNLFSWTGATVQTTNVLADLALQIALTRGAGAGGNIVKSGLSKEGLSILSKVPVSQGMASSATAQTFLGYSEGLENTLVVAKEAGISDSEAKALANDAAIKTAGLYLVTSGISPQSKASFVKKKNELIKEAIDIYAKKGKPAYVKFLNKGISSLKEFFEEGTKETFQEEIQQAGIVYGVNQSINEQAGKEILQSEMTADEIISMLPSTFIAGGIPIMLRNAGGTFSKKDYLSNLDVASNNVDLSNKRLDELLSNNVITSEEHSKSKEDLRVYSQNKNKIPKDTSAEIVLDVAKGLDEISKLEYQKQNLDKAFHSDIDEKIEKKREEIKDLYKKDKENESNKQTTGQVSEQEKPTTATEAETVDATQQKTELQSQEEVKLTPKTETDAVQKQITDEGVLQPEQSKMGLQEMEQGDKINQVVAEQSQEKVNNYVDKLNDVKNSDPETYWYVSSVTLEDASKGKIIDTKDGAAMVKPDGDIVGVFKKPESNSKGVAQDLLKKAVELGGIKLDNFDGYLTKQYEKAGFRVVSKTPFNEEFAPEGWNKEKHGTPDVVAMVYDPKGELNIEEKTFDNKDTGYDDMIAYRDKLISDQAPKFQKSKIKVDGSTVDLITEEMNSMPEEVAKFDIPSNLTTKEKTNIGSLTERFNDKVKTIKDISELDGVPFIFTISDQLTSGKIKNPFTGNTIDVKGGIGFNMTEGNEGNAWANTTEAEANNMLQRATEVYSKNKDLFNRLWSEGKIPNGHVPMAVVKMGQTSIKSNEALFRFASDTFKKKFSKAKRIASKNGLLKDLKYAKDIDQDVIDFVSKQNTIDEVLDNIKELSISKRPDITRFVFTGDVKLGAKTSPGKPKSNAGSALVRENKDDYKYVHLQTINNLISEPATASIPDSHIVSVVGVDVLNPSVTKVDHQNYPFGVKGQLIGILENPVHAADVFPEMYSKSIYLQKENKSGVPTSPETAVRQSVAAGGAVVGIKAFRGAKISTKMTELQKLLGKLKPAFPSVTIVDTREEFLKELENPNVKRFIKDGDVVYGFTKDGKVFLNPDKANSNTAIHEYSHIWTAFLKENNPSLLKKGYDLLEGTSILNDKIVEFGDNELARDEAMAELIANKGETIIEAGIRSKFINWLNAVFNYVKSNFKSFDKMSATELQNLNLNQFLDRSLSSLLGGKEITSKETKGVDVKFSKEANKKELSDAKKEIQSIFSAAKEALKIQKDRNKVIDGLKKDVNKFVKSAIQDLEAGDIGKRAISSIISKVQSVTDQNFEEKLLEVNDILDNLYTNRDVNKAKADSKNAYSNVMSGKVGKLDKEGDMDKVMSSKVVGLTMLDPNILKKVLSDDDFSQYKDYINRLAERSLAIKETDLKAINDLYDRIISPYTDHVSEVNRIQQIIDAGGTLNSAESKFLEDNKSEFSERETPESIAEKEAKKADRDAKKQAEIAEKKRKIKELLPFISDVFASSIAEKGSIEWDILENLSNLTDEDIESMPENMLNNVFNALNSMVYNDVLVSYANEIHKYKLKQDHKKTFTETLSKAGKKGIYKAKLIKPLLKLREVIGLPMSAIWNGIKNGNLKQEIIDRRIKFFNFSSIDAAVKVYGETPIFNNIMSRFGKAMARVSSAEEKAETILLKVKKDLDKKSKNPQESYMKIVYHLIDAMAKNNVGTKSEVSAMEYFEATLSDPNSKIAENNRAKELIQAFVNKVKANNNEIEELTKEELNAVNAIRKVLDDNKINAYEANFFQNSNASPMINAYYPVMNSLKNQAEQDLVKLKNRFGISNVVSIKSGNLEEKTGTAHPIDMNPFSTAFSSIKSTIFQHQLRTEYQALKQALSELEIENTNNKEVLSYLSGIKKAVDSQFELLTNGVVGTEQTLADDVLNAMDKSFYTLALGSVISRGVDFLGNMVQLATISPKILANNRRVLNNLLAIKKDDESGTEILRNFYKNAEASDINKMISSKKISTERTEFMNRGANRGVLSKGLPSSNIGTKIKARITDPITSATSGAVDLLLGFGDVKPYGMSWNGVFYEEFKKQAGVEVDVEKIARGDVEYLKRYKDAIKKASNKANQENADLYGSTNPMEKKVGIMEIAKKPVKSSLAGAIGALRNKAAYLFSSFDMNARNAINTSINTYIENQDSREARKLIGGAVRLAMYSASINYITSALWNAFKGDDDDEDELKKSFDKLSDNDDFIKYVNSSLLDFPIQKDAEGNIIQLNIDDLARYNEMRDKLMSNKEFAKAYDIMYGYLNRDLFDIQVRSKVNQINQGNYEYDRSVVDGFFTDIDNGFGKSGEDIIEVLGILNSEQGYKMFTQEEIDGNILKVEEYMSKIDFLNNRAIRESGGAIDRLLITKVASTLSDYRTDTSLESVRNTEGLKLLMGMMFSRSNNFGKAAANYSAEFANKLITESKRGERGYDVYKDGIFQSPVKYKLKEDASLIDDAVNVLFPVFQKFDKYRYSDYSLPDLIRFTPMGILGVNDLAKINSKMKNDVIYQETNGKYKENILKDISKTKIDILRDKKKVEQDRLDEQFKKSRVIPGVKETKLKSRFPSYNENKDLKVNGRSAN